MYARFNVEALCCISCNVQQDIPCFCDLDQHPASGSFNWAVFLTFDDGVKWVLRSACTKGTEISMGISSKHLKSEAAVLKYMKLNK